MRRHTRKKTRRGGRRCGRRGGNLRTPRFQDNPTHPDPDDPRTGLANQIATRMVQQIYVPPVVTGDALDDPLVAEFHSEIQAVSPQEPALMDALNRLRNIRHELRARTEVTQQTLSWTIPFIRQHYTGGDPYVEQLIVNIAHDKAIQDRFRQGHLERDARLRLQSLLAEAVAMQQNPLDIEHDCANDENAEGAFVSGISMEELVPRQTVKLSDDHCYSYSDIVQYYNHVGPSGFRSPFTREPFTSEDIAIVRRIRANMGSRGGKKKTKRRRVRK